MKRNFFPLSSHDYIIFYFTSVSVFDPPSSVLKPKYTPALTSFPLNMSIAGLILKLSCAKQPKIPPDIPVPGSSLADLGSKS